MTLRWRDIEARNRETEALADRWELRIHTIALVLTGLVLAMRLVAGRQDLTPTEPSWDDTSIGVPGADGQPSWASVWRAPSTPAERRAVSPSAIQSRPCSTSRWVLA
jgi:hypothetical protein